MSRVGDRGVREGLTNDGNAGAVHFFDGVRLEDGIFKFVVHHVLGDKIEFAGEVPFDNFLDSIHAIGELPVAGHHVHAH